MPLLPPSGLLGAPRPLPDKLRLRKPEPAAAAAGPNTQTRSSAWRFRTCAVVAQPRVRRRINSKVPPLTPRVPSLRTLAARELLAPAQDLWRHQLGLRLNCGLRLRRASPDRRWRPAAVRIATAAAVTTRARKTLVTGKSYQAVIRKDTNFATRQQDVRRYHRIITYRMRAPISRQSKKCLHKMPDL